MWKRRSLPIWCFQRIACLGKPELKDIFCCSRIVLAVLKRTASHSTIKSMPKVAGNIWLMKVRWSWNWAAYNEPEDAVVSLAVFFFFFPVCQMKRNYTCSELGEIIWKSKPPKPKSVHNLCKLKILNCNCLELCIFDVSLLMGKNCFLRRGHLITV